MVRMFVGEGLGWWRAEGSVGGVCGRGVFWRRIFNERKLEE